MTKTCSTCQQTKPLIDFQTDPRYALGVKGQCRSCLNALALQYYYARHEELKARQRRYRAANPEREREHDREYRRRKIGSKSTRSRYTPFGEWSPERRQKHRARQAVNRHVKTGKLPHISTQRCGDCGEQAAEYDHYLGYERDHWLDVQPVCMRCNRRRGAEQGATFMYGIKDKAHE